jgi:hypothetical protein
VTCVPLRMVLPLVAGEYLWWESESEQCFVRLNSGGCGRGRWDIAYILVRLKLRACLWRVLLAEELHVSITRFSIAEAGHGIF